MTIQSLKRIASPKTWKVKRKSAVWIARPNPRAKLEFSIPLGVLIRDLLGYARTMREVKKILNAREVLVNGKKEINERFGLTLFDVVEIAKLKKTFRITLDSKGRLAPEEAKQAKYRLCRIENKTTFEGKKLALNLFDGTNVLAESADYAIGDVVKLSIPENKISGKLTPAIGSKVLVIDGGHAGAVAEVAKLNLEKRPKEAVLKAGEEEFATRFENIYAFE